MITLNSMQSAIYFDLEMNCPDRGRRHVDDSEIIEIGIVELNVASLEIMREANYLARPHRAISQRCTRITGLVDDDFKGAATLTNIIGRIRAEWPGNATGIAWGNDGDILTRACRQRRI